MQSESPLDIVRRLVALPETEWVEFKENKCDEKGIGEYLSALSNSAALHRKDHAYLVWGIRDGSHEIVGTKFRPKATKVGNQPLESWLAAQLRPHVDFVIEELEIDGKSIALFVISPATSTPIAFQSIRYIRVGSTKHKLQDYPGKEKELWSLFQNRNFERDAARHQLTADEVLQLLDYPRFFELTRQALPPDRDGILDRLVEERLISRRTTGNSFDITNLGAVLFCKDFRTFESLDRKAVRVVVYEGVGREKAKIPERIGARGYAADFESLIEFINDKLPHNEHVGKALRTEVRMYPKLAIRELVANALIHQDFTIAGTGPIVEIFADRIEIANPGSPLIDTDRFIDSRPPPRNDWLARLMYKVGICEERGSGIDKVILEVELFQLPAPEFKVEQRQTKAVLFAYQSFAAMDARDRIRACYQHVVLQHSSNQSATNASLRKRFGIADENYSQVSRVIRDAINAKQIKPADTASTSKRLARYVPYWA